VIDTSPRYNQASLVVVRLISLQSRRTPCVLNEQATSIPHDPRFLVFGEESSCIRFKVVVRLKTCSTYCSKSPHVDSHHYWQQSGWTSTIAGKSPGWTSTIAGKGPGWTSTIAGKGPGWTSTIAGKGPGWTSNLQRKPKSGRPSSLVLATPLLGGPWLEPRRCCLVTASIGVAAVSAR